MTRSHDEPADRISGYFVQGRGYYGRCIAYCSESSRQYRRPFKLHIALFIGAMLTINVMAGCAGQPDKRHEFEAANFGKEVSLTSQVGQDIAEAVFRYQFEHNESGAQNHASVFFLQLGSADPDSSFLSRFVGHQPQIKAKSTCTTEGGVIDKETGKSGLIFRVRYIAIKGENTVEVSGGYREGVLSASSTKYVVTHKGDGWVVETATLMSISLGGVHSEHGRLT